MTIPLLVINAVVPWASWILLYLFLRFTRVGQKLFMRLAEKVLAREEDRSFAALYEIQAEALQAILTDIGLSADAVQQWQVEYHRRVHVGLMGHPEFAEAYRRRL